MPKSKSTQPIVISFSLERETKNTYRFAEDSDEPVVGTLYVQKSAFNGSGAPDALTVTITV